MTYNINDIIEVLSESTLDSFLDIPEIDIYNESEKIDKAVKTVTNVGKKVIDKTVNSKVGETMGKVYNKVTETPGDLVAKAIYGKRPEQIDIQKEYDKKVINIKSNIKTGITVALLATKSFLLGPPDWIITICMVSGLLKNSEVNDETKEKIRKIKDKAVEIKDKIKELVTKHKDKDCTDKVFQKEYNDLLREGNVCAREADTIIKKFKNKPTPVAESSIIDTFDKYLLTESGSLVDDAVDKLIMIVESTDYEKYDIYPIIEHYCDMIQ